MFSKTIIDSDVFLDMPLSAQCLYFHLSMRADDEGFINNPRKIQRMIGASDDDLKLLIAKQFVIVFETGIIVIKHWKIHNYIRGDRLTPTAYQEEKQLLTVKENGIYECQSNVSQMSVTCLPQNRLGKVSLGQDRIGEDIYCAETPKRRSTHNEPSTPSEYNLVLKDGTYYNVPIEDIEEYKSIYKAVNVELEFSGMVGWCISHVEQRKTRRGIKKFITTWLNNAQKGGYYKQPQPKHNYQQHEYTEDMFGKDFFYDLEHDHV